MKYILCKKCKRIHIEKNECKCIEHEKGLKVKVHMEPPGNDKKQVGDKK